MGRFRSKLIRHSKGKHWNKGQSALSNPERMKYRLKAKSTVFRPNLNLCQESRLTIEAVQVHEQGHAYASETKTVNDFVNDFNSVTVEDDCGMPGSDSNTKLSTIKTCQTFASGYSSCSNVSFKKLLSGFRTSSDLHKEMLAILTALTDIIRERGGTESSTEYFLLLINQVEGASEEISIMAGISLLSMGIKSVPAPVLRKHFNQTAGTLYQLLRRFMESSNQLIIRHVIGCLSVLLRAQDYLTWTYSSTFQYFDVLLSFSIHTRPKIRKAAQHAVVLIICSSSFLLPPNTVENDMQKTQHQVAKIKHPASARLTKFCLSQFKPEVLTNSHTTVLYILTLLKNTLSAFRTEDIRNVCEHLLSIMTATNTMVRTSCFQTLYALFLTRTVNVNATLCGKLLAAIHEYRPDRTDIHQTLAWITVLKEGYLHLATIHLELCMQALPGFFDVLTTDHWLSERSELVVGVSNCIKELLQDCVANACATKELADNYRQYVAKIIVNLQNVLNMPVNKISKYVILTFSIVFGACGKHFSDELIAPLKAIGKSFETQTAFRLQIEHTLICAIKSLGPELVLKALPLNNNNGDVCLERSWLLPLIREGTNGASLQFFKEHIVPLALNCQKNWSKFSVGDKNITMAHIYELLSCQLWGLFPGFCRNPIDPDYFRKLAPTLGDVLESNPEFRAAIYDGLIELLDINQSPECHEAVAQYARNFLPRLFNIYTLKPTSTYEANQRIRTLDVIRSYIERAPEDVQSQLFVTAKGLLSASAVASFEYDAYFDINAAIVRSQKCSGIKIYFENYMVPVLCNDNSNLRTQDEQKLKKQQSKTYRLLRELMTSDKASCQKFTRKNCIVLQQILLEASDRTYSVCQSSRLHCLKSLLECRPNLTYNDQLVIKVIPEAVLHYKQFSTCKEHVAEQLIKLIVNLYHKTGKINELVDILTAGFTGDESLITNTILALRTVLQQQGHHLTVSTLEFLLQQVSVFLVQQSRHQAEAAIAFLITFIKVLPIPLVANHLNTIMRALSAMTKDTKRYCRIQIGYFLRKLCKRFTAEELASFVPGDDVVTHRRLKKIRKQMRRDTREDETVKAQGEILDEDLIGGLKQKSYTIDDILADSDSDLDEHMETEVNEVTLKLGRSNVKSKQLPDNFIREDNDEITDLADLTSIGKILSGTAAATSVKQIKLKSSLTIDSFQTADDGRLIISEKALRGKYNDNEDCSDRDWTCPNKGHNPNGGNLKLGMEQESSDEEIVKKAYSLKNKREASDIPRMPSVKTDVHTRKGIYRPLERKELKATNNQLFKKINSDSKHLSKLDPYAYIPLKRVMLNKRKRTINLRKLKKVRGKGANIGNSGEEAKMDV